MNLDEAQVDRTVRRFVHLLSNCNDSVTDALEDLYSVESARVEELGNWQQFLWELFVERPLLSGYRSLVHLACAKVNRRSHRVSKIDLVATHEIYCIPQPGMEPRDAFTGDPVDVDSAELGYFANADGDQFPERGPYTLVSLYRAGAGGENFVDLESVQFRIRRCAPPLPTLTEDDAAERIRILRDTSDRAEALSLMEELTWEGVQEAAPAISEKLLVPEFGQDVSNLLYLLERLDYRAVLANLARCITRCTAEVGFHLQCMFEDMEGPLPREECAEAVQVLEGFLEANRNAPVDDVPSDGGVSIADKRFLVNYVLGRLKELTHAQ